MRFRRGDKTAERDWCNDQTVERADYDSLIAELGGEPVGDAILLPAGTPEGSDHRTPERWRVRAG